MYTVSGLLSAGFYFSLLKIWYLSFMGLSLGSNDRLKVVKRGESGGGMKQRTFLNGDKDPEDIMII